MLYLPEKNPLSAVLQQVTGVCLQCYSKLQVVSGISAGAPSQR